ncbi:Eco57I restriction-modification methylase domain-containing protein [Candidatus Viridilinea mediisalina]|uniref:site-specific DNA-methyltransferase (adenine-specific) n=1 Tax=Candidatus Viridilinea mediisalina TaxID=2024553 RepID=A0A2A6RH52_9CHLR|nr:TaqI-like C-terminal specificity domain-containing protein [Candidatus Viridilinea mediisalina]PDW02271.1 hypothetical protein CJ255_14855 [Candidatus Viridilinea mediisalina]
MPIITPALLADLHDAAALRRFFGALGYAEQQQVSYTAQTLAWPENVAVELRGRVFELLADADAGFFQVLLLAPTADGAGLSQALLQRLFATLEQRGNEGLLLLPASDWATLELVLLVDPRPLAERQGPPALLRFRVAPRALYAHHVVALELLAVHAAGPGDVGELALRAFRRAQYERFFRSVNFFSSYYLEERIATDTTAGLSGIWLILLAQMPALRPQLAAGDARATLAALGWTSSAGEAGAPERLYFQGRALALVALLPPDHPLDLPLSATRYPQLELLAALEQQRQQQDGLAWAILTNGRTWRLYSHLTASISGAFYEVELAELLAYGSAADLRYFAGFFGAEALSSQVVLHVFASSQTLARATGENLKQVVFARVFPLLANAIADDLKRTGEYDGSAAQLQVIFRATLLLLYRILFVLYAESMRLLPTMHPAYYPHSLTFLLSDLALQPFTASHLKKPQTPTAYWAWQHLQALFAAISHGQPDWGVPKYNGGLFSAGAPPTGGTPNEHRAPHRLLARVQLGALDLGQALDLLGRDDTARAATMQDGARRLIDYAGLDVRRLGSIYEGLLEFQLLAAASGDLELQHTRAERKASGSYYTPDYIVAYIVEQAVGPVLAERAKQFAALMERLPAARRALEQAQRQEGNERISIATTKAKSDAARRAVAELEHAANESLLDLKILDPAMGSGHFLVAAVNFITDRLIVILNRHQAQNPLLARLAAIRTQIRASLQAQGVDTLISDEQLNNVNLLRRLVMKRCVFGVDLNDMAVELARLSLWLNSFTVGAPLNFLDHHLKWGNALIGARVQAVQQAMEGKHIGIGTQLDMFTSGSAFAEMLNLAGYIEQLVEIADANAQQVEQSEALYRSYEEHVVPVKRLLDLWVAQSFGNKVASELLQLHSGQSSDVDHLVDALMGRRQLAPHYQQAVAEARNLFQRHRFLHWDLDFPEVFLDLANKTWKPAAQMGFDAVVGNPPYVVFQLLGDAERNYLRSNYGYFVMKGDIYILFQEVAGRVTKREGNSGYIIQNKWLHATYGSAALKDIVSTSTIRELIDFHDSPVFEVSAYPLIIIRKHSGKTANPVTKIDIRGSSEEMILRHLLNKTEQPISHINVSRDSLTNINYISLELFADQIGQGVLTGHAEAFVLPSMSSIEDFPLSEQKFILPVVAGSDIGRYDITSLSYRQLLIYPYESSGKPVQANLIPNIIKHLTTYREELENRRNFGEFLINQGHSWYELRHPARGMFQRKIIFPEISLTNRFHFDEEGNIACIGSVYFLIRNKKFADFSSYALVSILNSSLLSHKLKAIAPTIRGGYYRYQSQYVKRLPIRRITFTTPAAERTALVAEGQRRYEAGLAQAASATDWRAWREHWRELWAWAEARLPQLADGNPDVANEQSDVVHDLLAHLAEQMIALHKRKQAAAAHFTDWLAQETGSAPSEWTLKTVVQSFWAQPWLELERALQKNRGRFVQTQGLRGKHADAALQPLLRAAQREWMAACATLAPTLSAISATDRLIDLLVYRLYGLTDEEIDLVEG